MGLIRTTYEIITEESAAEYDVAERGWKDEEGTDYTVDEAIELVRGCEPSASFFHVGIWYTMYGDMDMYAGKCSQSSQHPKDAKYENESYLLVQGTWSEDEQRAIYQAVKGK